ncbi:MAG: vitamin K epoxide reductase family protein [Candidatus Azambacteria bacterium]|nr:vitamin K epoxide reductase family protein [Candidatus Azambacteria bacterium]
MKKFLLYVILFLTLVGAVDAGYLLIETMRGEAVVCPSIPVGRFNLNQCNIVLATPYAKTFGLPNALYGLTAYLIFVILVLYELNRKQKTGSIKLLSYLSGLGFLTFIYFIYLQLFVIEALCFYCLLSAPTMVLIFILSVAYNTRDSIESV